MWKFLGGVVAAMMLMGGGLLIWQGVAGRPEIAPDAPSAPAGPTERLTAPPTASEATREERRFNRYDKDRDGKITADEYLASRRKAYAKLDTNGDGRLSFEEWAIKTTTKFASADADRSAALDPTEFATTKVLRKTPQRAPCRPIEADD